LKTKRTKETTLKAAATAVAIATIIDATTTAAVQVEKKERAGNHQKGDTTTTIVAVAAAIETKIAAVKVIATETVAVIVAVTEIVTMTEIDTVTIVVKNILLHVIQNDLAVKVKKRPKSRRANVLRVCTHLVTNMHETILINNIISFVLLVLEVQNHHSTHSYFSTFNLRFSRSGCGARATPCFI
jgi:hypothetical protein